MSNDNEIGDVTTMDMEEIRRVSLSRADELKSRIEDYLQAKRNIPTGIDIDEIITEKKERIKKVLGASENSWNNWKWQLSNRIKDLDTLGKIISLDEHCISDVSRVEKVYAWAISPYYCTLMDEKDPLCPIRSISIPRADELCDASGELDPMKEELTNPAGTVTRRYPDRLIINVTNECGSYCRFCQRRRNIGCTFAMASKSMISESVEYVRNNAEIRDVLVTGGDPLTLKDDVLDWILSELRAIPHVEIIRLGTRTPVTLPMRITKNLCRVLKKYQPLYINTHFNHPIEICKESKKAVERLADSGIPIGNQMVLLNGINNDKYIVKRLNQELLKLRVRPYYIFHPKSVKGTSHFKCSIDEGLDIMQHLRGYTSGLAVPYYIINASEGMGKIPLLPEYYVSEDENCIFLRNWEGKIVRCDK